MQQLIYKSPLDSTGKLARFLHSIRNMNGAYVIRKKSNHEILYIGECHSSCLAKTVKRHFWNWKDEEGLKHFTCNPENVEIAIRYTPPNSAVSAQNNLIERLTPRENKYGYKKEDGPF